MRHVKVLGLCLVAVFALAAMTASGASAKSKGVLQFDEGANAAPKEAPGMLAISIGTCVIASRGHLTGNDAAAVTLSAPELAFVECNPLWSESGSLTSATLSTKGKLTMSGTIDVTTYGGCTYAFSKWKLKMKIPGEAVDSELKLTGKLDKAAKNNPKCGKTLTEEGVRVEMVSLDEGEPVEPFNTVLVP